MFIVSGPICWCVWDGSWDTILDPWQLTEVSQCRVARRPQLVELLDVGVRPPWPAVTFEMCIWIYNEYQFKHKMDGIPYLIG